MDVSWRLADLSIMASAVKFDYGMQERENVRQHFCRMNELFVRLALHRTASLFLGLDHSTAAWFRRHKDGRAPPTCFLSETSHAHRLLCGHRWKWRVDCPSRGFR